MILDNLNAAIASFSAAHLALHHDPRPVVQGSSTDADNNASRREEVICHELEQTLLALAAVLTQYRTTLNALITWAKDVDLPPAPFPPGLLP